MLSKETKLVLVLIVAGLIIGFITYRELSVIQTYIPHMILFSVIYGLIIFYYYRYEKYETVENSMVYGVMHSIGSFGFLVSTRYVFARSLPNRT